MNKLDIDKWVLDQIHNDDVRGAYEEMVIDEMVEEIMEEMEGENDN